MSERRIINRELCERVDRFEELGTGIAVYILDCGTCRGPHRGMLIDLLTNHLARQPNGRFVHDDIWLVLPVAHGTPKSGFTRYDVETGHVWRVVDDKADKIGDLAQGIHDSMPKLRGHKAAVLVIDEALEYIDKAFTR